MSSPQPRLQTHYRNSISPTSTCSDEDSSHSQPNDLTLNSSSRKHNTFPNYPSFYSPPHHSSLGHSHQQPNSPYVATNECRIIEYRGARIAAFLSGNKNPCEYLLCLPQAFELFLKHLVGGLHTVYTKLKRLDIVPIVCNVEQVRILRGLGAIQPGVNRCKLLATKDFDTLYKDCTTASTCERCRHTSTFVYFCRSLLGTHHSPRPGRPPKRSPVAGMVSPVPTTIPATAPQQQPNSVPYLGFPPTGKKPRYADDAEFTNETLDLKHQSNNTNGNNNPAATAAAMLAANGYSFPFLQHFSGGTPTTQQQQQLVAAAAALGLPGLPPTRFANSSPPPGLPSVNLLPNSSNSNNSNNNAGNEISGHGSDFNPTAAYLWLLSQQQQQHQHSSSAALNLSSRNTINNNHSSTTNSVAITKNNTC
ncbi:dachshund-2-like protein [Leptotrombidium deliense]|uniref:Dachshund-2-like protein n=1 Tax=Leptotrombidium deliense TaxID=299467 RepID=A0A443STH3_9ACAR|nr:dachshund-2-like protein [Leptotrombidium deliense]